MLQRLEGEVGELEEELNVARQAMEEQDAAITFALEEKVSAGDEVQQTLEDLATFAEEVRPAGSSRFNAT